MQRTSILAAGAAVALASTLGGHTAPRHIGEGTERRRAREALRRDEQHRRYTEAGVGWVLVGGASSTLFTKHNPGETGRQLAARLRAEQVGTEKPKRTRAKKTAA